MPLRIVSATHANATRTTPRLSQKLTDISTTTTYKTAAAMSKSVVVSTMNMPAASVIVAVGKSIGR